MPRLPRIDLPDTVYHIYTRGNRQAALFLDDEDRVRFMTYLRRTHREIPFILLSYSLMTNHYHFELRTLQAPLGKIMHLLNTLYASYFNHRYGQSGHLFQGRFHSIAVQVDGYLLNLCRYIDLNAVEAGIVLRPEDYAWSSARLYLTDETDHLVDTKFILGLLSDSPDRQRDLYRKFLEDKKGKPPQFKDEVLRKTRILGSPEFIRETLDRAGLFPVRVPLL